MLKTLSAILQVEVGEVEVGEVEQTFASGLFLYFSEETASVLQGNSGGSKTSGITFLSQFYIFQIIFKEQRVKPD